MLKRARERFMEPSGEFTPIPFWFWNDELKEEELIRQIREFRAKEVEGFVLHPRIGIPESMPYLSDAFMDLVEAAVREAANLNMKVILYDEGMYPSGAANGEIVRRNPELASRGLRKLEHAARGPVEWEVPLDEDAGDRLVSVQAVRSAGEGAVQAESAVVLAPENGRVRFAPPDGEDWLLLAFVDSYSFGTIRGIHYGQDDGEPNAPRAADLLNEDAVSAFIELTHERYFRRIGAYFGSTVIAMFTDEPDLLGRGHRKGMQPWTADFLDDYLAAGARIEELAALWYDAGERTETIRAMYRKTVRERMERVYYKPLHDWCESKGIALTGHPAASDDIGLLNYFHIPGQDVVWRWVAPEEEKGVAGRHSTLGKCSSDAARHRGRRRNLNECFGVCGTNHSWSLTADDLKWYLDWLFVRGVNLISPHAFYYSIEGKRLYERGPDVGPNNIWWPEFARFARYIKRMSWTMTDGRNVTNVAVLCQADRLPWEIAKPLFERQIEFNYVEEDLLQEGVEAGEGAIAVRDYRYDTVLYDRGALLEPATRSALASFVRAGGTALEWAGGPGSGAPDLGQTAFESVEELAEAAERFALGKPALAPAAKELRISHVAKDGVHLYVIANEGETPYDGTLTIAEQGRTELWDGWNGTAAPAAARPNGTGTDVRLRLERRECLVVAVDPSQPLETREAPSVRLARRVVLTDAWSVEGRGRVELSSWTTWEDMEHYSGTIIYEADLDWDASADAFDDIVLDLGDVRELARVVVNGHELGARLWGPYRWSVKDRLQPGANRLRVEVTNSLANRYDRASLPSGLLGPTFVNAYTSQ
ncbi:glycosylhydrolase-like jelly roll fold domain-containing protein [Paenibacillus sp.]|uniref:glycosylhydrolase-like jelly roll fold domain-containing protein n=1 Tax=Paenibacillus sp. TaxID=58172 RepID=UPI002D6129B0|nr:glycosylhydrolase-like jelly roll fold domain-containing protein [Paenibacillus sp.]HZG87821.1 glycosyl hydrolase [Paenibacillus sp.]